MSSEKRSQHGWLPLDWIQSAWIGVVALCAFVLPLSSSGAWILLAPASIVLCYLAGRRLKSLAHGLVPLGAGAAGSALVLWFSAQLSVLGFGVNLVTAVVLFVFLPWFVGRSRHTAQLHRQQERAQLITEAGLRERARIAAQMHDELGHDLSLIALQASALQVSSDPGSPAAAQAAAIREQSDAAIENLHQIIGMLREPHDHAALVPAGGKFRELIAASRAKGMRIAVTGQHHLLADSVPTSCAEGMYQLVRETLTNAARYAPESEVMINFDQANDGLGVSVATRMPSVPPDERAGATGLAVLRCFFASRQGRLSVNRSAESFRV